MTKIFSINGKTYQAKEFDFNMLCDLEEQGLSLEDIDRRPMSLIRVYFMFCSGLSKDQAGAEIESHIAKGGEFNDVVEVMSEQMNNSGFFRSLNKRTTEGEKETSTKSPKSKKE